MRPLYRANRLNGLSRLLTGYSAACFHVAAWVFGLALSLSSVSSSRPHLVDPSFTMKAAAWYGARAIACPPQYRAGRDQLFRNSERDREELTELKLKAKPKTHATTWKQAAE